MKVKKRRFSDIDWKSGFSGCLNKNPTIKTLGKIATLLEVHQAFQIPVDKMVGNGEE